MDVIERAIESAKNRIHYIKRNSDISDGHFKKVCNQVEVQEITISALEKQKAKKPYQTEYDTEFGRVAPVGICGVPYKMCPNRNTLVWGAREDKKKKFCDECGQKLDWSVEE